MALKIEKTEPEFIPRNPKDTPDYSIAFMSPSNLVEQQERFFANNCKVNPVVEYANFARAQKNVLNRRPNDELLYLSKKIMDSFIQVYGFETNYLESEGDTLSKDETEIYIREYIE